MKFKVELDISNVKDKKDCLDCLFEIMEDWVIRNKQPNFVIKGTER